MYRSHTKETHRAYFIIILWYSYTHIYIRYDKQYLILVWAYNNYWLKLLDSTPGDRNDKIQKKRLFVIRLVFLYDNKCGSKYKQWRKFIKFTCEFIHVIVQKDDLHH